MAPAWICGRVGGWRQQSINCWCHPVHTVLMSVDGHEESASCSATQPMFLMVLEVNSKRLHTASSSAHTYFGVVERRQKGRCVISHIVTLSPIVLDVGNDGQRRQRLVAVSVPSKRPVCWQAACWVPELAGTTPVPARSCERGESVWHEV